MPNTSGLKRGGQRGRPKGALNRVTIEVRDFAKNMIERPEYAASLQERIDAGKAPHMETVLFAYAYGKPRETVEHDGNVKLIVAWAPSQT